METWKKIPGFEKYKVSNTWRVITTDFKRTWVEKEMMWTICRKRWYKRVTLTKNWKCNTFFIHYLVCLSFYGNRPEGKQIDHKDSNKLNNNLENLEYVTQKVNIQRAFKNWLHENWIKTRTLKIWKKVAKINKYNQTIINTYNTITEAWTEIWKRSNLIGEVCRWQRKSAYWFLWKFL